MHSPFAPGAGGVPPYMAGREHEQRKISSYLDQLRAGHAPAGDLIVFGPRGNGKTSLLLWAERTAQEQGIEVVELNPSDAGNPGALAEILTPRSWLAKGFGDVLGIGKITFKGVPWVPEGEAVRTLTAALARRVRKRPLLVSIDEAHTLEQTTGRALLTAVQRMRRASRPLLLILAGTPNLLDHLGGMQATFWERSTILPLMRLDEQASADAVRIPLEDAARSISAEALSRVAAESHGYPYFLQLWGDALWSRARSPEVPLGLEDVECARPWFEEVRNRFYGFRYRELEESGLVARATAVAAAFGDEGELSGQHVSRVLREALAREGRPADETSVAAARRSLNDLGYVWSPGGERRTTYHQGIPSLMNFVIESARD